MRIIYPSSLMVNCCHLILMKANYIDPTPLTDARKRLISAICSIVQDLESSTGESGVAIFLHRVEYMNTCNLTL